MIRQELLTTLKRIEPALSAKEYIAVFSCICFDGKTATAYDDVLALKTPCETEFVGGIKGKVFLEFLRATKTREVAITPVPSSKNTIIKAGKSKLTLPFVAPSEFIFTPPDSSSATSLPVTPALVEALEKVNVSIGSDPTHPWRLGITIKAEGKMYSVFASNGYTLSRAKVPSERALPATAVILPPRFVELLLGRVKSDGLVALKFTRDWITATFESGLEMFSKAIIDVDPARFEKIINDVAARVTQPAPVDVPPTLHRCMERAQVVLTSIWVGANSVATDKYSTFSVTDGVLSISTIASRGDVFDKVKLPGHEDVELRTSPELLLRVLPFVTKIQFVRDTCVKLDGENFEHFISIHTMAAPAAATPKAPEAEVAVEDEE